MKTTLDFVRAAPLALLFSPLLVGVAIALRISDRARSSTGGNGSGSPGRSLGCENPIHDALL